MRRRNHGIFCLEADWQNDFNRTTTVKPVLKLLSQGGVVAVPFVHRTVATQEEFAHYCKKWAQKRMARFPILYLAFHGEPECILVGDRRPPRSTVRLDELAEILGTGLRGRYVHFGSCETLRTDQRNVQRFLQQTGALAATGFKEAVDWFYSSVFEVLLLECLTRRSLKRSGAQAVKREMYSEHKTMCKTLDFRMVVRK